MGHTFGLHLDEDLVLEGGARWLAGLSKLSRDDTRLLGYPDAPPEVDVCNGVQ